MWMPHGLVRHLTMTFPEMADVMNEGLEQGGQEEHNCHFLACVEGA